MEQSRVTKILAKITVRPARIPIFIFLIAAMYKETGSLFLAAIMVFIALVFDMLLIMVNEQFKILNTIQLSLGALSALYEEHDADLAEVERKAHVHDSSP